MTYVEVLLLCTRNGTEMYSREVLCEDLAVAPETPLTGVLDSEGVLLMSVGADIQSRHHEEFLLGTLGINTVNGSAWLTFVTFLL